MDTVGCLVADTHVRTAAVVESNEAFYVSLSGHERLETMLMSVYALAFEDTVHSFCNSVVGRFVVLRHGYLYAVFLKLFHIHVAAILDSAVGMVDESGQIASPRLGDGHAERS